MAMAPVPSSTASTAPWRRTRAEPSTSRSFTRTTVDQRSLRNNVRTQVGTRARALAFHAKRESRGRGTGDSAGPRGPRTAAGKGGGTKTDPRSGGTEFEAPNFLPLRTYATLA